MSARIGVLIGPYARQVTNWKLKFWFAFHQDGEASPRRYEVSADWFDRSIKSRRRPFYAGKGPKQASNFLEFPLPADLSGYQHTHFPRHERDNFVDAAVSLITRPGDVANLTLVRMGLKPDPQLCTDGDEPCLILTPRPP